MAQSEPFVQALISAIKLFKITNKTTSESWIKVAVPVWYLKVDFSVNINPIIHAKYVHNPLDKYASKVYY